MALIRWEPVRELNTLQSEMNRLFNTLFDAPVPRNGYPGGLGETGKLRTATLNGRRTPDRRGACRR